MEHQRPRPRTNTRNAGHIPAIQWLGRDQLSASVLQTANRLLAAQDIIRALVPGSMGQACRVALLDGTRMTLSVPSAAHAAKLRQMAPAITREMNAKGWNLSEIRLQITASRMLAAEPPRRPKDVVPLDAGGLQAFSALQDTLRPGPLADAIGRLLRHHGAQ